MAGWGKLVAGAILEADGALSAANEEVRGQLPERARDASGVLPGWGKLVAAVIIGTAGVLYATNERFRRRLPDLPVGLRERLETARAAGREASEARRAEILRDLDTRGTEPASGRLPPLAGDQTRPL